MVKKVERNIIGRIRALLIGPIKINSRPLFTLLYYTQFSSLAIFSKDNGKTCLYVLFLGNITFYLYCSSEIKGEKDAYGSEYD